MSKAEKPISTPASGLNRRGLLRGAGGIAAALALPATTAMAGAPFSPEFLEYRRCVQAHIDACDVPEPMVVDSPEKEAWYAFTGAACEARYEARLVIQNRSVRSRQDLVELAHVVRQELWQQEPDGSWHAHSINHELDDALMRAVFVVIDGGAHA